MEVKIGNLFGDPVFGDIKEIVGINPLCAQYDIIDHQWNDIFYEYDPPAGPLKISGVVLSGYVQFDRMPKIGEKVRLVTGKAATIKSKVQWLEISGKWAVTVAIDENGLELLVYLSEVSSAGEEKEAVVKTCVCPYDNFRWGGMGCTCGAVKRKS